MDCVHVRPDGTILPEGEAGIAVSGAPNARGRWIAAYRTRFPIGWTAEGKAEQGFRIEYIAAAIASIGELPGSEELVEYRFVWTASEGGTRAEGLTRIMRSKPLPPMDIERAILISQGVDPDNRPEATVEETALAFSELVVGTFYPLGFLIDVDGTTYEVARDNGFYYGAWAAADLIADKRLLLVDAPSSGEPPAWTQRTAGVDMYGVGSHIDGAGAINTLEVTDGGHLWRLIGPDSWGFAPSAWNLGGVWEDLGTYPA